MKPATRLFLCLLFSCTGTEFISCHKEGAITYASTDAFFQTNQSPSQKFSFTNGPGTVVQTIRGSKIHFPENAFVGMDNAPISGQATVTIEVRELHTPAEMILNRVPSNSYDGPLESGGEYFIGATANNKAIKLAAGKKMQIELLSTSARMDSMKVFTGYIWGGLDSFLVSPRQSWVANTDTANKVAPTTINAYSLFCDSLQWVNCDRLLGGTRINCSVTGGNSPSFPETRVFVHYTGLNTAIELYAYRGSTNFTAQLIAAPATIVGICIKNGRLYASITTENLQDAKSYPMNFNQTDENSLKATLSALK
ncbi:MAG TPA: hypothetical protein VGM41_13670 [Chitinophagaceae bacterium]|jgi:hypothetical protein